VKPQTEWRSAAATAHFRSVGGRGVNLHDE
jgi:hypothetical protein